MLDLLAGVGLLLFSGCGIYSAQYAWWFEGQWGPPDAPRMLAVGATPGAFFAKGGSYWPGPFGSTWSGIRFQRVSMPADHPEAFTSSYAVSVDSTSDDGTTIRAAFWVVGLGYGLVWATASWCGRRRTSVSPQGREHDHTVAPGTTKAQQDAPD